MNRVNAWRLLAGNPVTVLSALVLAVVVVISLAAQWIIPYEVNDVDVPQALQPPSGAHWFGTDDLGRDVLSRVLVAVQASMRVAVVSVAFAAVVGCVRGGGGRLRCGRRGGWLDTVLMRVVDVMFAFPVLLLALAIVAVLGPGIGTTILAIGVVYTPISPASRGPARCRCGWSRSCRCPTRWAPAPATS
jgi:peptide/nickel transport system permease protein